MIEGAQNPENSLRAIQFLMQRMDSSDMPTLLVTPPFFNELPDRIAV
jgi:hypothetical protein